MKCSKCKKSVGQVMNKVVPIYGQVKIMTEERVSEYQLCEDCAKLVEEFITKGDKS